MRNLRKIQLHVVRKPKRGALTLDRIGRLEDPVFEPRPQILGGETNIGEANQKSCLYAAGSSGAILRGNPLLGPRAPSSVIHLNEGLKARIKAGSGRSNPGGAAGRIVARNAVEQFLHLCRELRRLNEEVLSRKLTLAQRKRRTKAAARLIQHARALVVCHRTLKVWSKARQCS